MSPSSRITISRLELFMGFVIIGLMGFGGVATAARYVIVEKRKWLSELDYANILGIGQVLPGGNIINMTIILGDRAHGIIGTCIALLGLMFMPLVILISLAMVYDQFSSLADVHAATMGAAATAAGLVVGMAIKMGRNLKLTVPRMAVSAFAVFCLGVLRLPLVELLIILIPLSSAVVWWERKR
jgi:chromate transporter